MGVNRRPVELVQATAKMMQERLGITIYQHSPRHAIDVGASELVLKSARLAYRQLVLALGSELPRPRLDGTAAASVLTVNRLSDYAYLHHQLQGVHSLVIIGSSVPACEFANDLASNGFAVTLIDTPPYPLASRIPTLVGERLMTRLEQAGVRFLMDDKVLRIDRRGEEGFRVLTAAGSALETDMVFAAPMPQPRTALAEAAGLEIVRDAGIIRERAPHDERTRHPCARGLCSTSGSIHTASIDAQAEALSATLHGTPTRPDPRPLPLRLNTPACAMVLMDPPRIHGEWHERPTAVASPLCSTTGAVNFGASFSRAAQSMHGTVGSQSSRSPESAAATSYGIPCTDAGFRTRNRAGRGNVIPGHWRGGPESCFGAESGRSA